MNNRISILVGSIEMIPNLRKDLLWSIFRNSGMWRAL